MVLVWTLTVDLFRIKEMKPLYIIFVIIFSLTVYSCENKFQKKATPKSEPIQTDYKPYFQFDKVDHYFIDIDMGEANDLNANPSTEKGQRQAEIICRRKPDVLEDSALVKGLEKYDFIKTEIPNDSLEKLNQIFHEKEQRQWEGLACTPVYRDILVFYKNNQITGIAKLCFHCQQFVIVGTTSDTDQFGLGDEFDKLYFLLHGKNLQEYLRSGPK